MRQMPWRQRRSVGFSGVSRRTNKTGAVQQQHGSALSVLDKLLAIRGVVVQSGTAADLLALKARGFELSRRERLFLLMNEPASSQAAMWFGNLMWILIIAYSIFETCESVKWIADGSGPQLWKFLRYLFNIFFTCEACVRVTSFIPWSEFWREPYIWLDILTVIPFWIRVIACARHVHASILA